MQLKSKPTKPKRNTVNWTYSMYDGMKLTEAIKHFENMAKKDKRAFNLEEITIQSTYDYEGESYYFQIGMPETDETYQKKLEKYEAKLADYNRWYKENEESIKVEIEQRRQRVLKRQEKELLAAKAKAEMELKKLAEKLND